MSLTTCAVTGGIRWSQQKTNSGFSITRQGPDDLISSITPPVNTINELFAETRVIAAGATHTWDLTALTNFFSQAIAFNKARALHVAVSGGTARLQPGASDPATWFFGTSADAITLPDGSFITIGWGTNAVVTSAAKNLAITNTGATSVTVQIAILGGI